LSAGADIVLSTTENTTLGGNPTASGGTPPYTFLWNMRGNPVGETSNQANPTFGPAPEGTYVARLIVKDSLGATKTAYVNITVGNGGGVIGLTNNGITGNECGAMCAPNTVVPLLLLCGSYTFARSRRRR